MEQKIATLTVENFRALRQLKITGIGRVNLITGRNNTGKSSVLEALRILATNASLSVIRSILRYREENVKDNNDAARSADTNGEYFPSTLFNGFPTFSSDLDAIKIATNGGSRVMRLTIRAAWLSEERGPNGEWRLVRQQQPVLFDGGETIPALLVETDGIPRTVPLVSRVLGGRYPYISSRTRLEVTEEVNLPCVLVGPYGGESTATLGHLWDKIALSDHEKDVVKALRIIAPGLAAVSMVGERGQRTAIVRLNDFPRPVPLRSFGDGLNRLFGIVLSLVNAKDGLLLIDEFENGMHYSVQLDVWRAIFKLSRFLNIQVFATSHSWDSIQAFQKAAKESPEDGALIRLARRGEDIIATVFAENELAVATRDGIEVR
jgi:hypothetical protein